MREFHGSLTVQLGTAPQATFDLITDIARLPDWNAAIEAIIEQPISLDAGAEWVAVIHPARMPSWKSRSKVDELDRKKLVFAYTSRNQDGNPSYARWTWLVRPDTDGTAVTVRWEVHLMTVGRQLIAAPIRRRGLQREVPASLRALEHELRTSRAAGGVDLPARQPGARAGDHRGVVAPDRGSTEG